jgi:2-polyprenyl-6-methoxyphenol hydroxylase-like FAD-dependent oxidoreductase
MMQRTALVVGAGIGGLAAGIALGRAGWHVRVFERASSPRELGFALNLAPNAMFALQELGLAARLLAEGHPPTRAEMRGPGGRLLRRIEVTPGTFKEGMPSVVALRQALHGALLDAVGPDALVLDSQAVGFEVEGARVTLALADGRTATGDVLVGADGLGSAIRRVLHPHDLPARRSGYYGVRGVAHDAGHLLGRCDAVLYLARGVEAATVKASATAVYWYISLLAEDVTPANGDISELITRTGTALDDTFRAVTHATRPEDRRLDDLCDREPIDVWGAGPVTLLGDAAHPMLPHTGQGAAQALEDAVALGLALGQGGEVADALRRYERVRSARTAKIVRQGRIIPRVTTTKSPVIAWLRAVALRTVPAKAVMKAFLLGGQEDPHRELRS